MQIGKFTFNDARCSGYKLLFNWPGVLSIAHDDGHDRQPWTYRAKTLTVCIGGGINGGGRVWRFENYGRT